MHFVRTIRFIKLQNFLLFIFTILLVGLPLYLLFRRKDVGHGYKTNTSEDFPGISKEYPFGKVKFYHWGSIDKTADGDDPYFGFYALILTRKELNLESFNDYFDEIEFDNENPENLIYTLKKKKVFLGDKDFYNFLKKFDRHLIVYNS